MSNLIGIIGAMDIEVNGIISSMNETTEKTISGMRFYSGKLFGKDVVVSKCGVGKVFSAICAQTMILEFKPNVIINTGVAGALSKELNILDVVIAKNVVQHDMDTSAIGDPKGLISGINIIYFESDERLVNLMRKSSQNADCNFVVGTIATGDKFVSNGTEKEEIKTCFGAIACEMEGASIAQTCFVNKIPFAIIRAISDGEGAEMDFATFAELAAGNSVKITKKFIELF